MAVTSLTNWRDLSPQEATIKLREKDRAKNAIRSHKQREWREKNKERKKAIDAAWIEKNREYKLASRRAWMRKKSEKDALEAGREYKPRSEKEVFIPRGKAKKEIRRTHAQYAKERKSEDPEFALACKLRVGMYSALVKGGARGNKSGRTVTLLGCTITELRKHLENKWKPGMSWANYGRNGWHVDHIRPVTAFNLLDPAQQKLCFHFTNLQPLWEAENIRKSNKVEIN